MNADEGAGVSPGPEDRFQVLVCTRESLDREVITFALQRMRPQVKVFAVAPEDLDSVIPGETPFVVVCQTLTEQVLSSNAAWVHLDPVNNNLSTICLDGELSYGVHVDLDVILGVIDSACASRLKRLRR